MSDLMPSRDPDCPHPEGWVFWGGKWRRRDVALEWNHTEQGRARYRIDNMTPEHQERRRKQRREFNRRRGTMLNTIRRRGARLQELGVEL